MYRLVNMSNKWYGIQIDNVEDDSENINEFVSGGEPVILCEDLNDLASLGIDADDIEMVYHNQIKKGNKMSMTEDILQHEIEYWFNGDSNRALDECDIEHIEKLIKDGCNQGELCQYDHELDIEYRGWWKIK